MKIKSNNQIWGDIKFNIDCDICGEYTSCMIIAKKKICWNCIEKEFKKFMRKQIESVDDADNYVCDYCGEKIQKPRFTIEINDYIWVFCESECKEAFLKKA